MDERQSWCKCKANDAKRDVSSSTVTYCDGSFYVEYYSYSPFLHTRDRKTPVFTSRGSPFLQAPAQKRCQKRQFFRAGAFVVFGGEKRERKERRKLCGGK